VAGPSARPNGDGEGAARVEARPSPALPVSQPSGGVRRRYPAVHGFDPNLPRSLPPGLDRLAIRCQSRRGGEGARSRFSLLGATRSRGSRLSASAIHRLSRRGSVACTRTLDPCPEDSVGPAARAGRLDGVSSTCQALIVRCSSAFAEPIAILRGFARSLTGSTTLSTPLS